MQNRKITAICLLLCAALIIPAILTAQDKAHEGFFMRFLVGAGPGKVTIDDVMGKEMVFTSTGSDFHFQIGKSISQNLILFGDLGGFSLTDPDVEYGG